MACLHRLVPVAMSALPEGTRAGRVRVLAAMPPRHLVHLPRSATGRVGVLQLSTTALYHYIPAACRSSLQFGEGGDVESSNKKLYAALAAEFLGMMLFALYGGEARDSAAACGCSAGSKGAPFFARRIACCSHVAGSCTRWPIRIPPVQHMRMCPVA